MNGVRRTLIATGFSALAAFAANAQAASIPEGPYVGVVGGYQSTSLDWSQNVGGDTVKIDSLALTGARAGIVAGWSEWSHGIYGALELNAAFSTGEASISANSAELILESNETYGASLLFGGRVVRGTLLYARVGYQRTKFSTNFNWASENLWFDGIRAGVGGMWALSDVVTFRLEYTHTFYHSETLDIGGKTLKLEPDENVFQMGFTVGF